MRLSLLALSALAAPALGFVPRAPAPAASKPAPKEASALELGLKSLQKLVLVPALIGGVYTGASSFPAPAFADGSVSAATVTRAGGLYGPRIIKLKEAVAKGDIAAVKAESASFRLFNSGAFALNRPLQKEVQKAYSAVEAAVNANDAAALKTAFDAYFKKAGLDKTNPFGKDDVGQAFSSDFAFTRKNPNFDK